MKGVPPEIDSLMWRLADEGGPAARAEFEARHTRYGPELARRIAMVSELRQAGKAVVPRPTFTPRPVRPTSTPSWAVGTAVGLVGLAVAAIAYVTAPKPPVPPKPLPVIVPRDETPLDVPPKERPLPRPQPLPVVPGPKTLESLPKPSDVLRDTRVADSDLTAAIELVAAEGGLKVTVAPGFPEQRVTLDYHGLSTLDTLKAMGDQYGFSVLEEEEGAVLVVPVRSGEESRRRVGP